MKRKKWKRKVLRCGVLCAALLLSAAATGCTTGRQTDTGATGSDAEVRTDTDADGFTPVRDYVKTRRDGVRILESPDDRGKTYMKLDQGVDLQRIGYRGGWTKILLNRSEFYVKTDDVTETTVQWATGQNAEKVTHTVFIDPAKQITEDTGTEPYSPDADAPALTDSGEYATATAAERAGMKPKMTAAGVGVSTGTFEYTVTREVAEDLEAELERRGYTVILSRTSDNVNISNAKRAQMADSSGAELYLKLETPSVSQPSTSGILAMITTSGNSRNGGLYENNYELAYDLLKTVCDQTGGTRMGIYETDALASLNYCQIPAVVMNIGFLSNKDDDEKLATADYKEKMASALADGIDLYFQEEPKK